jgi:mycofactocin precursor
VPQRRADRGKRPCRGKHPGSGGDHMAERPDEELTADELLVEEVSIDGMCGVY